MTSARLPTITTALAAALFALTPDVASAGVVVAASGPSAASYPVGRKLGDSERIVLRAGDTLTVLDGAGTRVLRGAGTYSLNQHAGPSQRGTFAVLTERRSAQRVTTGATRVDPVPPTHSPNLWYVDVERSGTVCLAGSDRVRLWRKSTEGDVSFVISPADRGESHTVTFADGEMLAPWNTRMLPIAPGTTYRIASDDGVITNELSFVVLDTIAEEPEALAEQLIENGCTTQLELLSTATLIDAS